MKQIENSGWILRIHGVDIRHWSITTMGSHFMQQSLFLHVFGDIRFRLIAPIFHLFFESWGSYGFFVGVRSGEISPSFFVQLLLVNLLNFQPSEQKDKWNLSSYRLLALPHTASATNNQNDDNLFGLDTSESLCQSASSSSTLDHEVGILPRALSDISERTEETEGFADSSTMPKKSMPTLQIKSQSTTQSGSGNQCLRPNSLGMNFIYHMTWCSTVFICCLSTTFKYHQWK